MDFVLWVCRVMHVVSVVVWIGGLIFLNAILNPVVEYEKATRSSVIIAIQRRFQPFVWSSLWSLLITGFLLMLLSPRFLWFDFSTTWSQLLAVKVFSFLVLGFFGWQQAKVLERIVETVGKEDEVFEGWRRGYHRLVKRSIGIGLVALLSAAGMMVV